jgi:hypothetical protein
MNLHTLFLSGVSQTALARSPALMLFTMVGRRLRSQVQVNSYVGGRGMSNESAQQLGELRNLARHNIEQINRAAVGLLEVMRNLTEALVAPSNPGNALAMELVRRTLDTTESNVGAFCDHALKLAQASSPAECLKLQTEFVRSSIVAMQKQSTGMMEAVSESARDARAARG